MNTKKITTVLGLLLLLLPAGLFADADAVAKKFESSELVTEAFNAGFVYNNDGNDYYIDTFQKGKFRFFTRQVFEGKAYAVIFAADDGAYWKAGVFDEDGNSIKFNVQDLKSDPSQGFVFFISSYTGKATIGVGYDEGPAQASIGAVVLTE